MTPSAARLRAGPTPSPGSGRVGESFHAPSSAFVCMAGMGGGGEVRLCFFFFPFPRGSDRALRPQEGIPFPKALSRINAR